MEKGLCILSHITYYHAQMTGIAEAKVSEGQYWAGKGDRVWNDSDVSEYEKDTGEKRKWLNELWQLTLEAH